MVPLLALTFATAFPQFDQKILQNQVAVHGGHSDPLPSWTPTPPADRLVGVAYSPWFDFPMKWASQGGCTWGMPSLGAYSSSDAAILRQHAVWLRDAGVDFVLMDWSNDAAYEPDNNEGLDRRDLKAIEDNTRTLFEVWSTIPKAPRVAFLSGSSTLADYFPENNRTNTTRLQHKADQIHRWFVANKTAAIRDLNFLLDGKPLLVDYSGTPTLFPRSVSPWRDSRFTMKHLTGFVSEQPQLWEMDAKGRRISKFGYWSWEDRCNSTFPVVGGHPEFMVVSTAVRGDPCGWKCASKREGRANGTTFAKKWKYAMEIGPRVALVPSWGQWVGCQAKPDENWNEEFSTDLEPMEGGHGDLYLRLLKNYSLAFRHRDLT